MKPIAETERLTGDGVILTPLTAADLDTVRTWRSRDDIRIWFGDTSVIDARAQVAWFERYKAKADDVMFLIRNDGGRPLGTIALYGIDRAVGVAEYGRVLIGEPTARGIGMARRASQVLIDWGYDALGLKHIVLWVLDNNNEAIRLYERLGFHAQQPAEARTGYVYMVAARPA